MHLALTTTMVPETLRLALTTGFLGGLTTYSSFNYETTTLVQKSSWSVGALNFGVTTVACLAAGLLGVAVARRVGGI
jgi:fluoride exporter